MLSDSGRGRTGVPSGMDVLPSVRASGCECVQSQLLVYLVSVCVSCILAVLLVSCILLSSNSVPTRNVHILSVRTVAFQE